MNILQKTRLYFKNNPVRATLLTLGAILGVAAFVTATVFTAGAFAGAAFATGAIGTAAASGGTLAFMFGSVNALAISAGVTALVGSIVASVSSVRLWKSATHPTVALYSLKNNDSNGDSISSLQKGSQENQGNCTLGILKILQFFTRPNRGRNADPVPAPKSAPAPAPNPAAAPAPNPAAAPDPVGSNNKPGMS